MWKFQTFFDRTFSKEATVWGAPIEFVFRKTGSGAETLERVAYFMKISEKSKRLSWIQKIHSETLAGQTERKALKSDL